MHSIKLLLTFKGPGVIMVDDFAQMCQEIEDTGVKYGFDEVLVGSHGDNET